MIYFIFFLLHCIIGQPLLNLYYTDVTIENNNIFQHNCLRAIDNNKLEGNFHMISFCLSENPSIFDIKDDVQIPRFTFLQLLERNITAEQLFYWSTPIDIIEKYQDYLNTKNTNLQNETYYNCTLGTFGNRCQYEFNILFKHLTLYQSINNFYDFHFQNSNQMPMTCYKHLECNLGGSTTCLDWRNICNGQIDCLNDAIDEKDCWKLKVKQCKENERLCLNGQCMKILTSEANFFRTICVGKSAYKLHLGQPIEYNLFNEYDDQGCSCNFLTGSCYPGHDSQLLISMYSNQNESLLSNNCSLALRCFMDLFKCTEFCQKSECIQIIEDNCPEMFFYPQIPILFGNIYFAYMKKDFIHSMNSSMIMPYLCYNTTDYDQFFHQNQTLLINNIRCVHTQEFYLLINQSNRSLKTNLDIVGDLYKTLKRYHLSMNYTTQLCNQSNMYQCIDSSKCVDMLHILNGIYDCPQMDDEIVSLIKSTSAIEYIEKTHFKCQSTNKYILLDLVEDGGCDCNGGPDSIDYCEDEYPNANYIKANILFQHICDRFQELTPILINGNNHTDETECEQWECNNIYTHCNGEWNCLHAEDEIDCGRISIGCPSKFYRCVSHQTYEFICLPLEKINDDSIDCLSATDEDDMRGQNLVVYEYCDLAPFYCINQSLNSFISWKKLCDGHHDCEHGDDERFCTINRTNPDSEICTCTWHGVSDVERFLCEYRKPTRKWNIINFEPFSIDSDRKTKEIGFKSRLSSSGLSWESSYPCHMGLPVTIKSNQKNNRSSKFACFCPPNYYGSECQYQNQRVSLILHFQTLSLSAKTLFTIVISLIDDTDEKLVHSFESFTYLSIYDCRGYFRLTLHYATRPKNSSKQYFIRVDIYEKLTLYHRGSLLYPIEFSFLPVHRLGFVIEIPSNNTKMMNCKNKQCQHGRCMKYWNQPDDLTFCQCDRGWRGKYCQIPYNCDCSSDALCFDVLSNNRSICLCLKNRLGTRCLISSTICERSIETPCLNGGECIVTEDYNGLDDQFICLCGQGFSGKNCELVDNKLILSFDQEIDLSQSIFIHYIHIFSNSVERSTTFKSIPIRQDFVTINSSKRRSYDDYEMVFVELLNGNYYIAAEGISQYVVNKTIRPSDRCLNIKELFNETFVQWNLIRRIKYYHLPCQNQTANLSCFHDEVHLCLCYNFYGKRLANCFRFEHNQTYDCFGRSECEGNSRCLQDHETCPKQSMCICNNCFFGPKCQLRTDQFGLSLDAILGYQILPINNFSLQPSIIKISLALTILLMIIGLINAILSIITFTNKQIREVGCGLYLLGTSITTLHIIILFSLKFFILLLTHMTIIRNESFLKVQCYSLDFLIRICLYLEQWLTACVACERSITVIQGVRFIKKKSKQAARKIIPILVIIITLSFIHDPLSRTLNYDNEEDSNEIKRIWCILRYQPAIEIYSYIIQTIHFTGPFIVNLISSIILIIKKSHQNAALAKNRSFNLILREQINEYKHLLIAPIVLVILALPRIILVYTTKCMRSADDIVWLYLFGYFISFIPSILTFLIFILPSKFYKDELKKTIVEYRKIVRQKLGLTDN